MAKPSLRPIHDQVVVITGASSGIGRATALQFAARGASVVAIARNEDALDTLVAEIERRGGVAHKIVADVSQWPQVEAAAADVVSRFGRIDTWVNNAGVALYATVEAADVAEMQRVIDVNLMGQIHGVKAALPYLKGERRGAILNVASALATRSVPLQAAYCAAKHGVKGFTESLRLELDRAHSGISVTLIVPSSIDTPLFEHARTKLGVEPRPIPPVYEPDVVAEAIVYAAEHRLRKVTVGGGGKALELMQRVSPKLVDAYWRLGARGFKQQKTDQPDRGRDNLFEPVPELGRVEGQAGARAKSRSGYTQTFEYHPGRKRLAAVGALVGAGVLVDALRRVLRRRS